MNSSTKVILGIIGAAAAGAVIGMLLAPEKGSDIRQRVKDALVHGEVQHHLETIPLVAEVLHALVRRHVRLGE